MAFLQLLLLLLAHLAVGLASEALPFVCPAQCSSSLDCSLNGVCSGGACACDAGWGGRCCGQFDFAPVDYAATGGGYQHAQTSTWGGNIIRNASTGRYHMWIAEMKPAGADGAGSCGLTTWALNSQITHVSSDAVGGPYAREEVAVNVWAHNPIVRQAPDGTYVLYHIGAGASSANATPPKGYCALNGTSPCGEQSFDHCGPPPVSPCKNTSVPGYDCLPDACLGAGGNCGITLAEPVLACGSPPTWQACATAAAAACAATPGCAAFAMSNEWLGLNHAKLFARGVGATPNAQWTAWTAAAEAPASAGSCTLNMHTAPSTAGPWTPYRNATISPCGSNNPGPFIHPNGTVFIVFTEQGMGLWRADSWQGPYTLVTTGACGGGEDPSLFIDARGAFHCMYHRAPFSDPTVAVGHSFSEDGFTWLKAVDPAANASIATAGGAWGGVVQHGKRERPHVYYEDGQLRAFVSAAGLVPACTPWSKSFDPAADCSSVTQYPLIDSNSPAGWYDKTYTLVQEVR